VFTSATDIDEIACATAIDRIAARPATGRPSPAAIENSLFGVEPNGAARIHPGIQPPKFSDFYLRAKFAPDGSDDRGWDIGVIWRIGDADRGLWWSIDDRRQWGLWQGVWSWATREGEELEWRELCEPPEVPVTIHALVVDEQLAVSDGPVVVVRLPDRESPG
jgi:hypothetical protein